MAGSSSSDPYDTNVRLMLRFKRGDDTAFTELMERSLNNVIRTIARFIGNRDEAEDLAQEVFLRIYNARERYRPTAKFSTWLYRIVTNMCWNYLRDRKKWFHQPLFYRDTTLGEVPREIQDGRQQTPSQIISNDELRAQVQKVLRTLPANQRMAVILAKYEGLSYQEIAEVMKTSVMAVKSLLNRAKNNLRKRLQPHLN